MKNYKLYNDGEVKNSYKEFIADIEKQRGKILKQRIFSRPIINLRMAIGYIMKYEYN